MVLSSDTDATQGSCLFFSQVSEYLQLPTHLFSELDWGTRKGQSLAPISQALTDKTACNQTEVGKPDFSLK